MSGQVGRGGRVRVPKRQFDPAAAALAPQWGSAKRACQRPQQPDHGQVTQGAAAPRAAASPAAPPHKAQPPDLAGRAQPGPAKGHAAKAVTQSEVKPAEVTPTEAELPAPAPAQPMLPLTVPQPRPTGPAGGPAPDASPTVSPVLSPNGTLVKGGVKGGVKAAPAGKTADKATGKATARGGVPAPPIEPAGRPSSPRTLNARASSSSSRPGRVSPAPPWAKPLPPPSALHKTCKTCKGTIGFCRTPGEPGHLPMELVDPEAVKLRSTAPSVAGGSCKICKRSLGFCRTPGEPGHLPKLTEAEAAAAQLEDGPRGHRAKGLGGGRPGLPRPADDAPCKPVLTACKLCHGALGFCRHRGEPGHLAEGTAELTEAMVAEANEEAARLRKEYGPPCKMCKGGLGFCRRRGEPGHLSLGKLPPPPQRRASSVRRSSPPAHPAPPPEVVQPPSPWQVPTSSSASSTAKSRGFAALGRPRSARSAQYGSNASPYGSAGGMAQGQPKADDLHRPCAMCGVDKARSEYVSNQWRNCGTAARCIECSNEILRRKKSNQPYPDISPVVRSPINYVPPPRVTHPPAENVVLQQVDRAVYLQQIAAVKNPATGAWTPEEDKALISVMKADGGQPGNWEQKAAALGFGRSGNAVGHRWRKMMQPAQYMNRKVRTSFKSADGDKETEFTGVVTSYDETTKLFTAYFEADNSEQQYTHMELFPDLVPELELEEEKPFNVAATSPTNAGLSEQANLNSGQTNSTGVSPVDQTGGSGQPSAAPGSNGKQKEVELDVEQRIQQLVYEMDKGRAKLGDTQYGIKRARLWGILKAEGWGKTPTSGSYGIRVDPHGGTPYQLFVPGIRADEGVKRVNIFDSWSQLLAHLHKVGWHGLGGQVWKGWPQINCDGIPARKGQMPKNLASMAAATLNYSPPSEADAPFHKLVDEMEWGRAGLGDIEWGLRRVRLWEILKSEGWQGIRTSGSYGIKVDAASCGESFLLLRPGVLVGNATKRVDIFDSWSQILGYLRRNRWHNLPPESRLTKPVNKKKMKLPSSRGGRVQSSHFVGVSWSASMSKWHAYVTISGGTNFSVGYFAGEEEAAHARDAGARKSSDTAGTTMNFPRDGEDGPTAEELQTKRAELVAKNIKSVVDDLVQQVEIEVNPPVEERVVEGTRGRSTRVRKASKRYGFDYETAADEPMACPICKGGGDFCRRRGFEGHLPLREVISASVTLAKQRRLYWRPIWARDQSTEKIKNRHEPTPNCVRAHWAALWSPVGGTTWVLTKYFGTRQHVGSLQNRRAASWASEQVAKSLKPTRGRKDRGGIQRPLKRKYGNVSAMEASRMEYGQKEELALEEAVGMLAAKVTEQGEMPKVWL